ncbi:MAG: energy-coupled thiamine transporter ThiT [Clostridia bacterium]|nr:energy-coupled thiamine transporter ThiT [Clostridia bacterium]
METKLFQSGKILALTQSAIFIALATVLSFLPVYEMPMGGSVTLASMLPILFIGLKFGYKWGLASSGIYAFIQLMQALIKGNVFIYCTTFGTVLICVLFDYIVPFGILGLSAFAKPTDGKRLSIIKASITFGVLVAIRFICHYITGVAIWGQWAPDGMGKYLYSLIYNGQYMLPELIITLVISVLLMSSSQIEKNLTKEN